MSLIDVSKYETICSCHKEVLHLVKILKKYLVDKVEELEKITSLIKLALGYGCSMEYRLRSYKKAVFQLNKTYSFSKKQPAEIRLAKLEKAILLLNKKLGFDPSKDKGSIIV